MLVCMQAAQAAVLHAHYCFNLSSRLRSSCQTCQVKKAVEAKQPQKAVDLFTALLHSCCSASHPLIESKVGSLNRRWASILSKHVKKVFGLTVPSAHSRRGGGGGAMPKVTGLTPKKCLQSRMAVQKLAQKDRGPSGGRMLH